LSCDVTHSRDRRTGGALGLDVSIEGPGVQEAGQNQRLPCTLAAQGSYCPSRKSCDEPRSSIRPDACSRVVLEMSFPWLGYCLSSYGAREAEAGGLPRNRKILTHLAGRGRTSCVEAAGRYPCTPAPVGRRMDPHGQESDTAQALAALHLGRGREMSSIGQVVGPEKRDVHTQAGAKAAE
jgi:hypothetical protein